METVKEAAMTEYVHMLLEMAEWLAAHGERDLARECRATADKTLDHIMYAAQQRQKGKTK